MSCGSNGTENDLLASLQSSGPLSSCTDRRSGSAPSNSSATPPAAPRTSTSRATRLPRLLGTMRPSSHSTSRESVMLGPLTSKRPRTCSPPGSGPTSMSITAPASSSAIRKSTARPCIQASGVGEGSRSSDRSRRISPIERATSSGTPSDESSRRCTVTGGRNSPGAAGPRWTAPLTTAGSARPGHVTRARSRTSAAASMRQMIVASLSLTLTSPRPEAVSSTVQSLTERETLTSGSGEVPAPQRARLRSVVSSNPCSPICMVR